MSPLWTLWTRTIFIRHFPSQNVSIIGPHNITTHRPLRVVVLLTRIWHQYQDNHRIPYSPRIFPPLYPCTRHQDSQASSVQHSRLIIGIGTSPPPSRRYIERAKYIHPIIITHASVFVYLTPLHLDIPGYARAPRIITVRHMSDISPPLSRLVRSRLRALVASAPFP